MGRFTKEEEKFMSPSSRKAGIEISVWCKIYGERNVAFLTEGGD